MPNLVAAASHGDTWQARCTGRAVVRQARIKCHAEFAEKDLPGSHRARDAFNVPHLGNSATAVPLENGADMRDLAELALSHDLPDASAVELTYARDGLYDLGAPLMAQWAAFATAS
jgi:hypothetical protein